MRENREQAIRQIGLSEGGYVNDPKDPGGETNYGITARTYAAWNSQTGRPQRPVRDLTKIEADEIVGTQYLDPIRFDDLPAGIDYLMADYAVNSGPSRAVRDMQALVGVAQDGINGLQTLAAIRAADQVTLVNAYCDRRLKFLRGLKTWARFGKGWTSRVNAARAQALSMIGAGGVSSVSVAAAKAREDDVSISPVVAKLTAQGGAAGGAVGAGSAALEGLPGAPATIVAAAAGVAGLVGVRAWLWRRVRT